MRMGRQTDAVSLGWRFTDCHLLLARANASRLSSWFTSHRNGGNEAGTLSEALKESNGIYRESIGTLSVMG